MASDKANNTHTHTQTPTQSLIMIVFDGCAGACDWCFLQEPKLAFEDVDASELYPCVMFYSSNLGEKVREPSRHTRECTVGMQTYLHLHFLRGCE